MKKKPAAVCAPKPMKTLADDALNKVIGGEMEIPSKKQKNPG